jgi:protein involved in polysaccharide export with SLBB domain
MTTWCQLLRVGQLAIFAAAMHVGVNFAQADSNRYELQIGDQVKITVFKEPDMSGTFKVGSGGTVSVPGIGELKGAGRTVSELRDAAVEALVEIHYAKPSVTVEVSEYSPVFVMGDVRNPGRHSYAPGLTVLQLVAVAGGYPLPPGFSESTNLTRDQDRNREDLAAARERYASQAIRRSRLLAEREGRDTVKPVPGLEAMVGKQRVMQIMAAEQALLRTRMEEAEQRRNLLRAQADEIEKGRIALEEQVTATKRLRTVIDVELKNVRDLRERGLTANNRVLELERISADTEMRLNSGISSISASNQNRVGIDITLRQDIETSQVRLAEQLIEAEAEMANSSRRIATAAEFLNASGVAVPTDVLAVPELARRFSIVRNGHDGPMIVSENTPLRPGDVLTVMRGGGSEPEGVATTGSAPSLTTSARTPPQQPSAN